MSGVEDYKEVIERRKTLLGELLKSPVSDSLCTGALSEVCKELDTDSCCSRNWKGLVRYLIEPSPDKNTIDSWSKHESPSYKMLCIWVDNRDEMASFCVLLEAMTANQSYSSADELLCYLESPTVEAIIIDIDGQQNEATEQVGQQETQNATTTHSSVTTTSPPKRSTSLVGRIKKCVGKKIWRSNSYPPTDPPKQPEFNRYIKDEIFIVCSSEDNQSDSMKYLKSFVRKLQPVRAGNWRVGTIHDLPGGPMTTSWLTERVEKAAYVIVCCSRIIKQISDSGTHEDSVLSQQSEYNLKFTLDFLITGRIYLDMCVNVEGKFLPILMPGNDFSCVLNLLACFKVFSWPEEFKGIRNYIMGKPERPVPKLGPKKQLVPCRPC